jgi:putative FmdB family regulatory protein
MPAYDYAASDPARSCDFCLDGFEATHGMMEPGPSACPECGAPVKRLISVPQVKGGRWSSARLLNPDNVSRHGFRTGTQLLEEGKLKL